ncbi:hypothetical protein [Methylobacterium soli]|uniref:Uncharacterized protein n=1 Tax=Methylobacterium soli TaxID=553447 RepID=A0A6L3SYZ7_9HYPH|nr:hypothetical protein [Methylobacterium soli]KAB1079353.1 hypothetical protein F6X53_11135 [Methylobacterium soli]GJE41273.1 hypothetical protein AEGHOMDF_0435 [Methylobacterium soli]
MRAQSRDILDVQHCAKTRAAPEPAPLRPEDFDDIIAEQAAQQQVLLMALRRIAALTRAEGREPAQLAARWRTVGRQAMDRATFNVAPGHERTVRQEAKARLDEIIEIGLQ